jgi:shikimate kinase
MSENIFLIGYRATGKTTISDILSKKLNKKVIHMDQNIIKQIGRIDEFVKKNGWKEFRKVETNLLKKYFKKK